MGGNFKHTISYASLLPHNETIQKATQPVLSHYFLSKKPASLPTNWVCTYHTESLKYNISLHSVSNPLPREPLAGRAVFEQPVPYDNILAKI